MKNRTFLIIGLFMALTATEGTARAQGRGQRGAPQPAKAIAPVDLTGYWVSVVSEDWRHRMTTPRKGDYESLPLNAEGRRVADTWDLTKDNQANLTASFGSLASRALHAPKEPC